MQKYQNFLDEVSRIEINLDGGNHFFRKTLSVPDAYKPVATLWLTFEGNGNKETRDMFRDGVTEFLNVAVTTADKLLNDYKGEVKLQPDKQAQLLIENRDWYVNWLADTYRPVDSWYHNFWDEENRTLDVDGLEGEIFIFCFKHNKPFMVGLTLFQSLYAYRFALEQFNALVMANQMHPATSTPPAKEKTKRGTYSKSQKQKELTIGYYASELRDGIASSLKRGQEPNKGEIEKPILENIIQNKGYTERTLRDHLPATKRAELFGEIRRQISELMPFNNR